MIYIIDDDKSVGTNLARLMRSAGFRARAFSTAEQFLASACNLEPGCLLVDVTQPGPSILRLQAELDTRGIRLPVIAVSARDDARSTEQARRLGARCLFRKPVDDQAMIDAIQWALESDKNDMRAISEANI